jgi:GT2 family glycosyltransferase
LGLRFITNQVAITYEHHEFNLKYLKMTSEFEAIGFVVIGRNEGERLKISLKAIKRLCESVSIVYVDSGSSDGSVQFAQSIGVQVVELDMSTPFTAARARNSGFNSLCLLNKSIKYVQFLDGDCELQSGWIAAATRSLDEDASKAVVSGRRRERYPTASIFNSLIDIEWNTPIGETRAVLGDMFVRVEAFEKINGFNPEIIAAEDDDFCIRVRRHGYTVYRLDHSMSLHDANLTTLRQWFKRAKRCGHGYANINHLHGETNSNYFKRELNSAMVWGALFPATAGVTFILYAPATPIFVILWFLAVFRTTARRFALGTRLTLALAYGFLIFLSKFAEVAGIVSYWKSNKLNQRPVLIEYK